MNKLKQKISSLSKSKEAKTLAGNFMWLSALKVVGYIFPLITMPYLARVIGVDSFGEIAFAASVIVFIETFTDFGFNYTATRDIAKCRENLKEVSTIFSNVFWSKILLMGVGLVILLILIYSIPSLYDKRLLLLLTFLYVPGHIIFPEWFFQAMEQMRYITILNILSKLLFTLLIFVIIKEKSDYIWQPLLTAIGYWISGGIALYYIFKHFEVKLYSPKWGEIKSALKSSYNMFFSLLLPNLYTNFSTILLRSSCGEVATGIYSAGQKFLTIVEQLFGVLSRTFYPFLARKMDKHQVYVYITGTCSVLACLFLFFSAEMLVNLFYTEEFADAAIVIKIMAIAPFSLFLMNTYGLNYLVLAKKEKLYRNIIFGCSIIGFVVTWILTPKFGYIGMATTISGIWFFRGIITYIYALRTKRNLEK